MSERDDNGLRHSPTARGALYLATFLLGAVVMSFEMLATRYLNPFFGSSIYTWGSLIAVVLGGMTCGYFAGGRIADRYPSPLVFALIIVPAPLLLALLPQIADSVSLSLAQTDLDVRIGVLTASMALFFLPTMLLSAASPFAIRLLIASRERAGHVAGAVTAISTAGSIVGTLGTVFFLIPTFGTRANTYGLALLSALIVPIILAPRLLRRRALLALLLCLGLGPPFVSKGEAASVADVRAHLINEVETPYNQIFVFREGRYVTMKFGLYERRYTQSMSNVLRPRELPLPYTRAMTLGWACSQNFHKALMIGLGGGSTVRYLKEFMPNTDFTTVEIDAGVIKVAKKYFDVKETAHSRIVERDARLFLNGSKERYDIIFVDAYRGWFVPFHLTTKEFYQLAKSKLAPGGCLVQNVDPGTLLFDATIATMTRVFANVETLKAAGNIIILAHDGPKRDEKTWQARAEAAQKRFGFVYDLTRLARDITVLDWDRKREPLTDDYAPAEILNMQERPPRED